MHLYSIFPRRYPGDESPAYEFTSSRLILLAGDFRQTLPVIPRSTPADEINACLKYSTLWRHVKTLKLTTNMRVQLQNDRSAEIFSHQLLEIGNGKVPVDLTSGRISLQFSDVKLSHSNAWPGTASYI
jgi:hypothetical protein